MPDSTTTLIDIIRHGEPVGGRRYRGHKDDPLSEKGWRQMRDTVSDHSPWDVIVSSPLLRCAEFARELAERHNLPLSFDDRLKEISWGVWEGSTKEDICKHDPDALLRYWSNPYENIPEGAELISDFSKRVVDAWLDLLDQHAGKHVIVVAHAGVTRAIMCHTLHIPVERMFQIHVKNAAITRIQVQQRDALMFNELLHHNGAVS
jgi:alpha-ribazole phosphatase/probable phosphoglycerate mutase